MAGKGEGEGEGEGGTVLAHGVVKIVGWLCN